MSDQNLLAFGCGVSMLAIAGAYVALRARFWQHENGEPEPKPGGGPSPDGSEVA